MMEPFPERPKRMHQDTYMRLIWEYDEAYMKQLAGIHVWLDQLKQQVG